MISLTAPTALGMFRDLRSLDEFTEDMQAAQFDQITTVHWVSAIPALPANGGFKLRGEATLENGKKPPCLGDAISGETETGLGSRHPVDRHGLSLRSHGTRISEGAATALTGCYSFRWRPVNRISWTCRLLHQGLWGAPANSTCYFTKLTRIFGLCSRQRHHGLVSTNTS